MGEALFERHYLAFVRTIVAFRIQGEDPTPLQALVRVVEEHGVRVGLTVDRDEPADTLDHGPLEFARDQDGRIAKKMHAGFDRKGRKDCEGVEPVQVVGDQHVVAFGGNALAALNGDAEERTQQGYGPQAQRAIPHRGLPLHGKKIGGRLCRRLHLQYVTVMAGNPSRSRANYLIGAPCSWSTPRIMPSLASRAFRYESADAASPFFVVSRSRRSSSSSNSVDTSSGEWVTSRPPASGTLTWCRVRWAIMEGEMRSG